MRVNVATGFGFFDAQGVGSDPEQDDDGETDPNRPRRFWGLAGNPPAAMRRGAGWRHSAAGVGNNARNNLIGVIVGWTASSLTRTFERNERIARVEYSAYGFLSGRLT